MVYNPDRVIFQGSIGFAGTYFDQRLKAYMSDFCYYPGGMAFQTEYDRTDLLALNACGGWYMLNEHYFLNPLLYRDED